MLLICLLIYSCTGQNSNSTVKKSYKGVPLAKTGKDALLKIKSQEVYSLVLDTCISRSELLLRDYVRLSPKMHQLIKFGSHQYTCEFVNSELGGVKSGQLVESFYSRDKLMKTFRYKLEVSEYDKPVELRIIFTDLNKLTEYRFFDWEDDYRQELIEMNWF